jgi:hypothetical protein
MTQITADHVEWAIVGRLRRMLEEPPHQNFNVTQAYALFTTILCWVMQHIRIPERAITTPQDWTANKLLIKLSAARIADAPWSVHVASIARIALIGPHSVSVPAPVGFENTHTADRFLVNLRDATAHGDARNVLPFNVNVGSEHVLAGFTFACAEFRDRRKVWEGKLTLLETDMRRIGSHLAQIYCDALRHSDDHHRDGYFGQDAASIREVAA